MTWFAYLVLAVLAFIGIIATPSILSASEHVASTIDTIQDGADKICGIDDAIYESLQDALGNDVTVQEMREQIDLGLIERQCGLDHINKYQQEGRKSVKLIEFACGMHHCIQQLSPEPKQ